MMQFTTIEALQAKIHRELGAYDLNEVDIIEMAAEALESIDARPQLEQAVAFCEVKNNVTRMPQGMKYIVQIARNNNWTKEWTIKTACDLGDAYSVGDPQAVVKANVLCPAVIEQEVAEESSGCEYALQDCYGNIVTNYEPVYYRPYFDLNYQALDWVSSSYYQANYTPVRLAVHSFFDTVVCQEEGWETLYRTVKDEYVPDWPFLKFSFKEGSVAIAYLRNKTDDRGLPLIPDRVEYLQAITAYVRWKLSERKVDLDPNMAPIADRNRRAWLVHVMQAANHVRMPSIDQMQNIMEQRSYLLPRRQNYYGFFGTLNQQELRTYKTPIGRSRYRWTS